MIDKTPILKAIDLTKYFPVRSGFFSKTVERVRAVDGISFELLKGKTLGLVGESGCGKTTTGKMILRLIEPTRGRIELDGENIMKLSPGEFRRHRKRVQFIFQDPYASLNPRMQVGDIVGEPLGVHGLAQGKVKRNCVVNMLEKVGLKAEHINRYPHEFSGGQRQRIGIARALISEPEIVIADEPVSALDVSIRAQIINLLQDLQEEFHLAYLFISHDLSLVELVSDLIAVMYLGKIVEMAMSQELNADPRHPYTKALLSAVPVADPEVKKQKIYLSGDVPSPLNPPTGCRFHTRCPIRTETCQNDEPELLDLGDKHLVACHYI